MIRRPPRSTPFPTRRSSDLAHDDFLMRPSLRHEVRPSNFCAGLHAGSPEESAHEHHHRIHRSEEHTSELQSQSNLVCRLLLEKKKTPDARAASRYANPALHT